MHRAYADANWLSYGLAAGLTRRRAGTDVAHGDFPYTLAANCASGMWYIPAGSQITSASRARVTIV